MKTLVDLLHRSSQLYEKRMALKMRPGYRTISWTYEELWHRSLAFSSFLKSQGVKPGDRVILWSENSPYWVMAFFGILLAQAIAVPLGAQSSFELLKRIMKKVEPKFIAKSFILKFEKDPEILSIDIDLFELSFSPEAHPRKPFPVAPGDLAEIMFTSGTTGDPKGVMLTHRNIVSNIEAIERAIPLSSHDRFLSILPLSHMFEQTAGMLYPLSQGCQITYAKSLASPVIIQALQEDRVTKMLAVPEFLKRVMTRIEAKAKAEGKAHALEKAFRLASHLPPLFRRIIFSKIHKRFGGSLRVFASGGAPLDPEVEEKWNNLGIMILQGYGLTETAPILTVNSEKERKVGSIGKPLPGVHLKIHDGEVFAKGPNIFQGYYRDEEKTKEAFEDGWFKTGDIGYQDKDGFFFVKGRKKYMILSPGGQNVFPEDIEEALNRMPGVKDSSVIGIQKGALEIHAFILSDEILDTEAFEELRIKINKKLETFQQIHKIFRWPFPDFPRSATRKVKREEVLAYAKTHDLTAEKPIISKITPLKQVLGEVFHRDPAEVSDDMILTRDLGMDSISRIELVARLEETLAAPLEERDLGGETNVQDLEKLLSKKPSLREMTLKKWSSHPCIQMLRVIFQDLFLFSFARLFTRVHVSGSHHLREAKFPVIFMANHVSTIDPLPIIKVLRPFTRRVAIGAATDVLYVQYKRFAPLADFLFNTYPFPRSEGENVKPGLEATGRLLDQGFSVLIFPEGKISPNGKLQPFKKGAGLLAVEMGVPIIPIKIEGTREISPPYVIFPRHRGKVSVSFGKPLLFTKQDSYGVATETIEHVFH